MTDDPVVRALAGRRSQPFDESDPALLVAIEHVRWCRDRGDSFAAIILDVTDIGAETVPWWPGFDDAVWAVARAWSNLPKSAHQRRAA